MHLTIHALLRWFERNYHLNVEQERSKCAIRWGYYKNSLKVTDTVLFKWLQKNWTPFDAARSSLLDLVRDYSNTFVYDDMKFVIRDGSLITVFEV